mgnify:CR=1 FL=1
MRLSELQSLCGRALVEANSSADSVAQAGDLIARPPGESAQPPALSAADRLAIYRHNSEAVRAAALAHNYPLTRAWLGDEYFDAAARRFARETPATSPDLNRYGKDFAEWLVNLPGLAEQSPPAIDLARLDWLRHELTQLVLAPDESALRGLRSIYALDQIFAACIAPEDTQSADASACANADENPADSPAERPYLLLRSGNPAVPIACQAVDEALFAQLDL